MNKRNVTITIDSEDSKACKAAMDFFAALSGESCGGCCKAEIKETVEVELSPAPAPDPEPAPDPSPAPPPTADVEELDVEGYPWDARIHVDSKAKLKDGTWRLKRKASAADIIAVKKEYDGDTAPPPQADTEPAPPPPAPAPQAPTLPAPTVTNFPELLNRVNDLLEAGLRTMADADQIAKNNGLESLAFAATLDPTDPVFAKIVEEIG